MIIVSDTSPVSNLILIQRLDTLQKLFSEIIVPPAVDAEVRTLQAKLDEGEAQAIVLALGNKL